jgi:serine/threonine-protein phosphatase 6 regulatory ankyrin repeat subunit B
LNHGTKIDQKNDQGMSSLHLASRYGYNECVKILLKHGAHPSRYSDFQEEMEMTPLHLASKYGHHRCVETLLDYHADINRKDGSGLTALHLATCYDHHKCVKILLNRGAKINERAHYGCTALHWASERGLSKCVRILLQYLEDDTINAKDYFNGMTALHRAVFYSRTEILKILLNEAEYGTKKGTLNVNEKDQSGRTALYYACQNGLFDCIKLLLDSGAQINELDRFGKSVLDYSTDHVKEFINDYFNPILKEPDY